MIAVPMKAQTNRVLADPVQGFSDACMPSAARTTGTVKISNVRRVHGGSLSLRGTRLGVVIRWTARPIGLWFDLSRKVWMEPEHHVNDLLSVRRGPKISRLFC